ncbi:MAG: MBL fold metallo-hydrolase [Gemmatimonadetes bacterium]|nr:MBL fold metallo-hydrolase [Gemmatimonadota bacterium]
MKLTFLGTGTSFGIPVLGCACAVCASEDPHDRRTRSGALLELPEGRLLVDTPPELRMQLLRERVDALDGVWITHTHADHLHGIDDLRAFSARRPLTMWVPEIHQRELRARFPYIFDPTVALQPGTTKPEIEVRTFRPLEPVAVLGMDIVPLPVPHGVTTVFGFRAGPLGYVTDGKRLPPETLAALRGVHTLVLNALWWGDPHPTHFNIEEAIDAARAVGAERTYLVHMTHRVRHEELERALPAGVLPAYDGLTVEL